MTDLLPPYHKPMTSQLDCDLANDRIAALEEAVRERDGELRELTRELEKERETSRLRLHYQQEAERERDERLTLEESATLARKVDEAEASLAAERELLEAALHWLTSLKQDYDEDGNGVRKWSDVYDECVANIKRLAACAAGPAAWRRSSSTRCRASRPL